MYSFRHSKLFVVLFLSLGTCQFFLFFKVMFWSSDIEKSIIWHSPIGLPIQTISGLLCSIICVYLFEYWNPKGLYIRIYQLSLHFSDTSYIGTSALRSQTCHDVSQNWTHTHNVYYTFCLLIIEPIYCSIGCLRNWVFDCINTQSLFLSCTQKTFCFTF